MRFEVISDRLKNEAELRFIKVLYFDGHYNFMGYCEFDDRSIGKEELTDELKNYLMNISKDLENAERRIFKKHGIDAMGKLNVENLIYHMLINFHKCAMYSCKRVYVIFNGR